MNWFNVFVTFVIVSCATLGLVSVSRGYTLGSPGTKLGYVDHSRVLVYWYA